MTMMSNLLYHSVARLCGMSVVRQIQGDTRVHGERRFVPLNLCKH